MSLGKWGKELGQTLGDLKPGCRLCTRSRRLSPPGPVMKGLSSPRGLSPPLSLQFSGRTIGDSYSAHCTGHVSAVKHGLSQLCRGLNAIAASLSKLVQGQPQPSGRVQGSGEGASGRGEQDLQDLRQGAVRCREACCREVVVAQELLQVSSRLAQHNILNYHIQV